MKTFMIATAALALLATGAAAQPQARQDKPAQEAGRQENGRQQASKRFKAPSTYKAPTGYQKKAWRKGETLPSAYRGKSYVVEHGRYGLSAPPKGYQYVRVGDDVVLVAIATGAISSVIVQLFQ